MLWARHGREQLEEVGGEGLKSGRGRGACFAELSLEPRFSFGLHRRVRPDVSLT